MRFRNTQVAVILDGVKCPYCKLQIDAPDKGNFDVFEGLRDDTHMAAKECIEFNEWINSFLCSDDDDEESFRAFLNDLEQLKR